MLKLSQQPIKSHPSSMSTISKFSPEILRTIFLYFVDLPRHHFRDIPPAGLYRTKDTFSTPLFLGHVCSSWRRVACSSPMLWSFVLLHRPSEKHIPLLHLWLQRSGNTPLIIHLQSMVGDQPIPHHQILRLLLPHSRRWKRFFVEIHGLDESINFSSEMTSFLISNSLEFPKLGGLVIKFPSCPPKKILDYVKMCNQLYNIPSLQSVLMPFPCLKYHNNLTAVISDNPLTFDIILYALRCCPNLTSMDVRLSSNLPNPCLAGTVEHPRLLNLRILDSAQSDIGPARRRLLNSLTTPNLVILDVDFEDDDILTVQNMLLRSNCALKSLSKISIVNPCEQQQHQLNHFFHLPQLHHLQQLSLRGTNKSVLELLTINPNSILAPVLPSLKFLEVQDLLVPVGSALSDLLVSRFESLAVAIVTAGECIWNTPLADKLWAHPGYQIVAREKEKHVDVLKGRRKDGTELGEYVHQSWESCVRE